jgi:hypothetical protein
MNDAVSCLPHASSKVTKPPQLAPLSFNPSPALLMVITGLVLLVIA